MSETNNKVTGYANGAAIAAKLNEIDGKMAATPSGDPMHYMYILAGNNWITYDETTGLWNYLGETWTTQQVRESYMLTQMVQPFGPTSARGVTFAENGFTFPAYNSANMAGGSGLNLANAYRDLNVKYIQLAMSPTTKNKEIATYFSSIRYAFGSCKNLKKIYGIIELSLGSNFSSMQYFAEGSNKLSEFKISGLKFDFDINSLASVSLATMYYMIANAGTADIKITLHADVYDSIFDDEGELTEEAIAAGITEDLLSTKSNVTLASA